MAYKKVYSGSFLEVQRVKQLLQSKLINPVVKDNSSSALLAGFGAIHPDYLEVFVRDDQVDLVLKLLAKV